MGSNKPKPAVSIRYETRHARCAWCWREIPATDTHTVISAKTSPPLTLRFHRQCWDAYRALAPVELGAVGTGTTWTIQSVEELRVRSGKTVERFAPEIGLSADSYRLLMRGRDDLLTIGTITRLNSLAIRLRAAQSRIDWSDSRALFNLRMHLGLSQGRLAKQIDASSQQVTLWDKQGVPKRSIRTWGRLSALAERSGFDAGMILDDYLWTRELIQEAVEASGRSRLAWATAGRCSRQSIQQWLAGTRPILRPAAWHLTRAAIALGVELPAKGSCGYNRYPATRKRLSDADEAKRLAALKEARWTIAQLIELGTAPDRVIAEHLGKSRNSVAIMRRAMGIPAIDLRYWDGQRVEHAVTAEEIQQRWDVFRDDVRRKAEQRRLDVEQDRGPQ